ncbi:MAG: hypothetical protein A3K66_04855 [Euryarchaeota archaeon RBG_16_67_27]|nr:MAG: hypothetical protein A3K66_04855 [Euryarchaeota archaeon RBG_16_67_27]
MAMTTWVLRGIEEGDAPAILLLARSLDKWFNQEGLEKMSRDLVSHGGFVAVREDRVLGFVTWAPSDDETANLTWMGVAEDLQRTGIGRALVKALVRGLRARGVHTLEVSTVADSVDYEPYAQTRHFYRAMGFVDHRVDPKYYGTGDDRYDRLVLRLALPEMDPRSG